MNVVSSHKEVVVCLDLFFCQKSAFVNEKSMTVSSISHTFKLRVDDVVLSI